MRKTLQLIADRVPCIGPQFAHSGNLPKHSEQRIHHALQGYLLLLPGNCQLMQTTPSWIAEALPCTALALESLNYLCKRAVLHVVRYS